MIARGHGGGQPLRPLAGEITLIASETPLAEA
jgi:hypothetical protein